MEIALFIVFIVGFTLGALSGSFITRRFYRRLRQQRARLEFAERLRK